MSYTIVNVTPDTPEWEEERRKSIGASEVASVLNLGYGTPLSVYKSKLGVDQDFDELLGWIGHESEAIIHRWVEKFSGLKVTLKPGFMARSAEYPFLHATFDRVSEDPFTTWQFKTAHQFAGHHWDEGIPTAIRVQVQSEMLVAGTQRAAVVVWIGGREFRLFWESRDERFIQEHLIPACGDLWERVQAGTPPEPVTVAEVNEVYPSEERPIELSPEAFETLERITVLNSDLKAQEAERDALKVALAEYVQTADTLLFEGRKVATWKTQKGRQSFDRQALELDHPEIVAAYTRQGADFKVLRAIKQKEQR